ncbi:MAG: DUF5320 domain-containing protein [Candidatus Omnitrophica bacterium]|nr:DUF5320 domain-containing protein [Candidatus Omnitrophota bacterium]
MVVWLTIILINGILMLFGSNFIINNNLVKPMGLVISLICIGLGLRVTILGRKGEKEALKKRIKELEEKLSEIEKKLE